MTETTSSDEINNTIADIFQATYVIQQTHSGGHAHQGHQPMDIDQINGFKGKKGKGRPKGPSVKGKGKEKKGKGKKYQIQEWGQNQIQQTGYQPSQYHPQYQQPSVQGKNQGKGSSSQHKGKGKGKSSVTCRTCGRTGHTSNQCWWKGPVYQLESAARCNCHPWRLSQAQS
eukprot:6193767-Amphidinium_carterae.1